MVVHTALLDKQEEEHAEHTGVSASQEPRTTAIGVGPASRQLVPSRAMNRPELASTLVEKLDAAVKTLDLLDATAVADLLLEQGIRGHHADCAECPVARYLTQKLNEPVRVGRGWAWYAGWPALSAALPPAVRSFTLQFDKGEQYQDLAVQ